MNDVRCVHCRERFDSESPSLITGGVYELNPKTRRMAWQCGYCYQVTIGDLTPEESNRLEEFEIAKDTGVRYVAA